MKTNLLENLNQDTKCQCSLCERTKKFFSIIKRLPSEEKEWMEGFYNSTMDMEEEYHMLEAYTTERYKLCNT